MFFKKTEPKITQPIQRVFTFGCSMTQYHYPPGRETPKIVSQDTGWVPCVAVKDNQYTGSAVLGISTLHKSNGIPVFSHEEAKDISTMRR